MGVIAFNLLTGKQPFEGTSAEIAYQVMNAPAPRVSKFARQGIPAELDELVAECLAQNPDQRPASAERVIARLDAIAHHRTLGSNSGQAMVGRQRAAPSR